MRKNRTMKTAGFLLALTLMTSCFVGRTIAKYNTSGEGMDSVQVDKFGVEVTVFGSEVFQSEYR